LISLNHKIIHMAKSIRDQIKSIDDNKKYTIEINGEKKEVTGARYKNILRANRNNVTVQEEEKPESKTATSSKTGDKGNSPSTKNA